MRTISRWLAAIAGILVLAAAPVVSQPVVRMDARDQVLRWQARQVYAVGAAEGRGADVFGGVAGVAFDGAENLYVLDRVNARVAVFDSTGRFVRVLGRRGGGPGEFSLPQQMAVTRAGEVIVSDAGHGALIIFGRDGAARSVRYPGVGTLMGQTLAPHPRAAWSASRWAIRRRAGRTRSVRKRCSGSPRARVRRGRWPA